MKLIQIKNEEDLGELTGEMLIGWMLSKQNRYNLSITAGNTPKTTYEYLIPRVKNNPAFRHVHYYNFDEIPSTDPNYIGVTMDNLKKLYFTPAQIDESQIHHLNSQNYLEHDKKVAEIGGIDAMLMGIGADSHYCGNVPGSTNFEDETVRIDASGDLREQIVDEFDDPALVPDHWVTMGPRSVMAVHKLVMIALGTEKAKAIWHLVKGPVDKKYPASILKMHPDLTVILDEDAASKLN